ncbi:hypothetical protein [Actinacidiphila oryziradicis]|nr:hypothetical protein [Actinacidiphila oryziradicis]
MTTESEDRGEQPGRVLRPERCVHPAEALVQHSCVQAVTEQRKQPGESPS